MSIITSNLRLINIIINYFYYRERRSNYFSYYFIIIYYYYTRLFLSHVCFFSITHLANANTTNRLTTFRTMMNESTNSSVPQALDLLTKSLSLACDMPPADIDTSEHLQLREFLLTACARCGGPDCLSDTQVDG